MDPADQLLLQQLEAELQSANRNAHLKNAIDQPLATMVLEDSSFSCDVTADGAETFSNKNLTVTVPKSCVKWHISPQPPDGPATMAPERLALLVKLRAAKAAAADGSA